MDDHMDSELSFYARLDTYDTHVNLLEVLHGKPAMATVGLFSGGFYTGKPQVQDHSHLLGLRPKNQTVSTTPLKLLFRYTAEGYLLVIKSAGERYNQLISKSWLGVLGARHATIDEPTLFTLVDLKNNPIKLNKNTAAPFPVSLVTAQRKFIGGLKVKGAPYIYLAETDERSKMIFTLSVS